MRGETVSSMVKTLHKMVEMYKLYARLLKHVPRLKHVKRRAD
jgi:hypothetical protein